MNKYFFCFLALLSFSFAALASEPSVWSVNTRAEVLRGDSRGVSVDQDGNISLAPRLTEVFKTGQSYIWSSVVDPAGNIYLGTGGDGKVFKVDATGKGALFADLAELNVSSLALGKSGEIFAGTSPDGKVYRMDATGKAEVYFSPGEKYIWSLAQLADGSLAVGTGDAGRIYKVKAANASPESSLMFDTSETHIISLAADGQGNLYAGTDTNGLVIRFGPDGKPFGLLDSPLREIHDIEVGPDGSLYVLAVGESASTTAKKDTDSAATTDTKPVSVEKTNTETSTAKSRYDLTNAKSAVYRILADGGSEILWASTTVTGFSLCPHPAGNGVLLGTSDKGRIYSIYNDGREVLTLQTDANQISTIRAVGKNPIATSSNPGSLYQFGAEWSTEGSYDSSVLDAKANASWGRIWWRSNGNVILQTRTGNTEKPDETWSAWSSGLSDPKGSQIGSPKARYLQWRATLKGLPNQTTLNEVNVAFLPRNIAPEVLTIQVLPTNVGLVPNPPIQIDPNIELTGLDPAAFGLPNTAVAPRRVYQRGATSLQWTAEDRNGDKMIYDVYYRESADTSYKPLRTGMAENFISIDGQSLADGRYIFKIVARDTPSNPAALALSGEKVTEPVDIDNTAPAVRAVGQPRIAGDKITVSFAAEDAASRVTRAEYSVNGGDWMSVYADDGISDAPSETYTVEVQAKAPGEYAVTIRVFDANGNAGNARAIVKK